MKFLFVLLMSPLFAFAADLQHRHEINSYALSSAISRPMRNTIWVSRFDIDSASNEYFLSSSGTPVASSKKIVSSIYDADTRYDMSEFYKKKSNRTKIISNFLLNSPNTVYSFGYDSGIAAEKINIEKSFFLGIVHVIEVYKKSYFSISSGSWFGGRVVESPCYDSYDREYWCQNLMAWKDYKPVYPKNLSYIDFKYFIQF